MRLPETKFKEATEWIAERIISTKLDKTSPSYFIEDPEHTRKFVRDAVVEFLETLGSGVVELNRETVMTKGDDYGLAGKNLLAVIENEEWLREETETLRALLDEIRKKLSEQTGDVRIT